MVIFFLFKDIKEGCDHDLPRDVDAAVTWKGRNYFFKGCTASAYEGKGLNKIVWKDDIQTISKVPCNLDAATSWGDHI